MAGNGNSYRDVFSSSKPASVSPNAPPLGNVPTQDAYLRTKQNIDALWQKLGQLGQTTGNQALTPEQLQQIEKSLQATGDNPLNLTALPGQLLQPQNALIPTVLSLSATGTDGQVVFYRHVAWRFSANTRTWSPISTIVLLDYEYNLKKYNASQYAPGVIFLSINTGVSFYEQDTVSGNNTTSAWIPLYSEQAALLHVDRHSIGVLTTAANNNGLSPATWISGNHFRSTMVGQQIWVAGNLYPISAYNNGNLIFLGANAGNQNNANYIFEYPSVNYPYGGQFLETDRNIIYYPNDISGTCNVNKATANNVTTWTVTAGVGNSFDVYWNSINIAGNNYAVIGFSNNTHGTIANGPANNLSGATFTVYRGAWWYETGEYADVLANIPGDLNNATDVNYRFGATDVYHSFRWTPLSNGSWDFAPGDPGAGWITAGVAVPLGGIWQLCDGSTATVTTSGGTTTPVVTANLTGNVFPMGGNFNGNTMNATSGSWNNTAHTDNENQHIHPIQESTGVAISAFNFNAGNSNATLSANFSGVINSVGNENGIQYFTGPGNAHNHTLSNNNALMNPPSEVNGGLPLRIALQWYMRC